MTLTVSPFNRVPAGWRRSEEDLIKTVKIDFKQNGDDHSFEKNPIVRTLGFASPNPCTPVNSGSGRIQKILLTPASVYFEDASFWSNSYRSFFLNLISQLGPDREYIVLCNRGHEKWVIDAFNKAKIPITNVSICYSVFDISVWCQDPFMATISEEGKSLLCADVLYSVGKDQTIAPDVTMQVESVDFRYSYLFFVGGNTLVTNDYLLLGKDFILTNLGRAYLQCVPDILSEFKRSFKMMALSVGTKNKIPIIHRASTEGDTIHDYGTFQPIFHLDMFITVTGIIDDNTHKEILLIGRPALAKKILNDSNNIYGFDKYFEEIETQLSTYFEIRQLPLYPTESVGTYPGNKGNVAYYLTYNNVVLENYFDEDQCKQVKVVYLTQYYQPNYPFKARGQQDARKKLDKAAVKIWQELGFEVRPIPEMEIFASGNGSVHCMQKTLLRKLKYSNKSTTLCNQ